MPGPRLRSFPLANLCGLLFLVGASVSSSASANLLGNSAFEIRPAGSGLILAVDIPPRSINSWDLTAGSIDWTGPGLLQPAEGTYSVDLEGRQADGAGVLEQTFPTVVGRTYEVGFAFAGNNGGGAVVKQLEVTVDAVVDIFNFDTTGTTTQNMGWVCERTAFTATGASATLSFESLLNSGFGPQIDLTSVEINPEFVNGGFETRPTGSGLMLASEFPPRVMVGWSLVSGSIDWTADSLLQTAAGTYAIDLEGRQQNGAGRMEQSFATIPGQTYRVDFFMAGNPGAAPVVKEMRVEAGNMARDYSFDTTGKTTVDMGWEAREFTFAATGNTSTLAFESLLNTGFGPMIDEVTVRVVTDCEAALEPTAVPTLSPFALLALTGALALGALAVRRVSRT
jgi:choice-of-anchor C domain-containing protein